MSRFGMALCLAVGVACSAPPSRGPAPAPPAEAPEVLFRDVTDAARLDFVHVTGATGRKYLPETMGSGGCALDADGDGRMDVYLVQSGNILGVASGASEARNRLYRNRGDGTFEDVTDAAGAGDDGYGMGAACADYDGDGDTDIYVLNVGPNVLYRNDGGSFTDVTARAGVGDARWGSSACFFDADRDGFLDLYVVNYLDFSVATHVECGDAAHGLPAYCHPDVYPAAPDVFYRNRGDGTFEDRTQAAGLADEGGKGLGVVAGDVDDDGDVDLYVTNDSTLNFLLLNRGDGTFEEAGVVMGVATNEEGKTEAGMGVDMGDVNGDGRLDIFVTNLSREANALYLGTGRDFAYATRQAGLHAPSYPMLGFGTDLLDLDDDGDLDLFVANGHVVDNIERFDDSVAWRQPSQVFLNDGSARFAELPAGRAGDVSVPRVGRGSVTLDYDDDGRLDVLVSFSGDRARLFRNVLAPSGRWLGLRLHGSGANTGAVGARVTVHAGSRVMVEEVRAGGSYQCTNDPRLHFGLGDAQEAESVTVRWPSGHEQVFERLAAGRYHDLAEK